MNLALPTEKYREIQESLATSTRFHRALGPRQSLLRADSPRIESLPTNTPAHDFKCPECSGMVPVEESETRNRKDNVGRRIQQDGRGDSAGQNPKSLALHYDAGAWSVRNLVLVPRFTYTLSVIRCRKALSPNAERHGWVGCSIVLGEIPPEAKIPVIVDGNVRPQAESGRSFKNFSSLGKKALRPADGPWTS